jgi:hypothetical protein
MRIAPVTRVLLLALAIGVLVDIVGPGNAAGVNAPLLMGVVLLGAALAAGPTGIRRMDPADAWLAPAALLVAGFAVLRTDDWLVTWDLVFAAALAAGAIGALGGGRITRGVVPHVLELAAGVVAALGVGILGLVGPARLVPRDAPAPGSGGGLRARVGRRARAGLARSAPVLRGLAIAAPLVLVFAVLFALADAVFARVAGDVLAWRPDIDLADLVGRAIVVGGAAWLAAGLLALGGGLLPSFLPTRPARPAGDPAGGPGGRSLGAASVADLPLSGGYRLGAAEAATVVLAVDALFAAFVGLQVAYLFGGLDTLAAVGLTYAEYARRGFFELVAVAVLAGMLVVVLDALVLRRSRAQLVASLVLLGLTAVVLVSAFVRLRLYQDAYGWTELRFVVLVAIGWLAAALVLVAVLLASRRARWTLHVLGIAVLVVLAGMNVVGPQSFVAERNIERALDPSLVPPGGRTGLDAGYLWELGDGAVPGVVAAWPRLNMVDRAVLEPVLEERARALAEDPTYAGWPSWNLARERARGALAAWATMR